MKKKTFTIDIKDKDIFLGLTAKKLSGYRFISNIQNDLKSIQKSKTLTLDNIQDLFTYLHDAEYSNTHYFDSIKDLILNEGMDINDAFSFVEDVKADNDYMMSVICEYFADLDNGEMA